MRTLLRRPNLLAYPGTAPGFDPSHVAFASALPILSLVTNPSGMITISPSVTPINTAVTTVIDEALGPAWNNFVSNGTGASVGLSFTGTPWTQGTAGVIFRTGPIAGGPFGFAAIAHFRFAGFSLHTNFGGPVGLSLAQPLAGSSAESGLPIVANTPYFAAVSFNTALNIVNFVLLNLRTGSVSSSVITGVPTLLANVPTNLIGNDGNGNVPLGGSVACIAIQNSFASLSQLLQWAQDPWSFWYPQKFDLLQAVKAAAGILNNQAVSITSSGLLTFVRSTGKKLPVTSTGSVSSIKSVAKKIPVSSAGVVSAIKSVAKKLSIASTGSVSAFKSMPKAIVITSAGAVSLLKKAVKIISITSVGTVNVTRAISKAVSITSTGVVSQIKSIAKTVALSSIGSLIISAIKSGGGVFNVGVNITSAGALSLKRAITKTTLVTSVGTVSVVKSIPRLVLIASTGAVTAIKSVTKTIAASCVGSVTAAGIKVKLVLITITSAGSVTLKRAIAKSIAVSSAGNVSVKKSIAHAVSLVSSGVVSVTKSIGKTILANCVGVASALAHTGTAVFTVTVNIVSQGFVRWLPRFVVKGPRESLARLFSNRAKPRTSEWPAAPREI